MVADLVVWEKEKERPGVVEVWGGNVAWPLNHAEV